MTTAGQNKAIAEIKRLSVVDPDTFELISDADSLGEKWLVVKVAIRIGLIETKEGGLPLREREEFVILIPQDYPFEQPLILVEHNRFAGFPHVVWGKRICLYHSDMDWNVSDGMFGLFDRLGSWLARAAINDMDPIEGPLEPPHSVVVSDHKPFVIRADAPCRPGESWVGLAFLEDYPNRIELVGWDNLSSKNPTKKKAALAVFLPGSLPMEFPKKGKDLLDAIEEAGVQVSLFINYLAVAAMLTPEGEPLHLVVGLPMRRSEEGSIRSHIAVWFTNADTAKSLRLVIPTQNDSQELQELKSELRSLLISIFELSTIAWCQVLEDRPEIVVRRDRGTPAEWFGGKEVLILGCGALGGWIGEIVARAHARVIHLVDNGIVKPGILARQNFANEDIGANKAEALAKRLRSITSDAEILAFEEEAHHFILGDKARYSAYDLVIDCTASNVFQMKLERDWGEFQRQTPVVMSFILSSQARHFLAVFVTKNSPTGIWDAYTRLKYQLCVSGSQPELIDAFYSIRSPDHMFQPEPGCSDPTFVGSTPDIMALLSTAVNLGCKAISHLQQGIGIALSSPDLINLNRKLVDVIELPYIFETEIGNYRIRILKRVADKAQRWFKENNRFRFLAHETGGLLWGFWEKSLDIIWIYDLSGPPPDSQHSHGQFICGVKGTAEEHKHRIENTYGACGFIGFWHTHPDFPSQQSSVDISNMARLVSALEKNQRKAVMMIFGKHRCIPTVGLYIYESQEFTRSTEIISIGESQFRLSELSSINT